LRQDEGGLACCSGAFTGWSCGRVAEQNSCPQLVSRKAAVQQLEAAGRQGAHIIIKKKPEYHVAVRLIR